MSLLLASTVNVTGVVLLGLLAAALLRKRSAAVRHWVLLVAVVCAAATPLVGQVVPSWRVPFATGWFDARGEQLGEFEGDVEAPPPDATDLVRQGPSTLNPEQSADLVFMAVARRLIVPFWLVGVGISLSILLIGLARLSWLVSRCPQIVRGRVAELLEELSGNTGPAPSGAAPAERPSDVAHVMGPGAPEGDLARRCG